ncbi:uncharacterized protein PAC_10499 [Phialocephala subalpina]|uniref:Uncharacterized protein n=1 Tax=Phialocephala subalpina TaxID=576137 RepID=A0A1L7X6G9_9HELO|nr:uncharacterized protein PAC_10499 [Phialocephala subalpina]
MAAHRLGSWVPTTPLLSSNLNLHGDASANPNTNVSEEETKLPSGRCNYTNLSIGGNAPRCGCRRFWDKALAMGMRAGLGSEGRSGFCMCEHHACYHDDVQEGYGSTPVQSATSNLNPNLRISNEVVMSDGSSTVVNTPLRTGQIQGDERLKKDGRRERGAREEHESAIPDTVQWGRYVHSGPPSMGSLPAIPSQCLLPSETGSMTSGGGSQYMKPFGGLGLRTLIRKPSPSITARAHDQASGSGDGDAQKKQEQERPMQIYEDANGNGHLQSLTEVATPSAQTSQDPNEDLGQTITGIQEALDRYADGRAQTEIALRPVSKGESLHVKQSSSGQSLVLHNPDNENLLPRIKHIMGQFVDFPNKISNHEYRLDQLENTSFSNGHIDDLREGHDDIRDRVGDLEDRVLDIDHQISALNNGSVCGRNHLSSFEGASVTSSAMIASALDRVEPSRVEALEAQVAELQASALPSHSRPWEVEVVFLPFGARMMGIWSSQHDMSQRPRLGSTMTDEWTQTQNSLAAQAILTARDQVAAWEKSATDLAEKDDAWLTARACGLRSRVDERLRSRGLVRLIQVCGPEARDVYAAMMKAFGDIPEILNDDPYTLHDENAGSVPKPLKQYLSLSNPWIPLRKIHKDPRLCFLNPSEMITPALWTVPFLSSSVAMRHTKIRRLYITHRDAYIQHLTHSPTDWTWQKLRQLPRVYPDQPSQSFSHTPEADAHEPCWEYDERLDPPHESIHSSFASQISSLSIQAQSPEQEDIEPASPSDHFSSAAVSRQASTTPTSVAPTGISHPLSPLKERKERDPFRTRPIHGRTISMPSLIPTKSPHLTNKRRITSFDHEHDDLPHAQIHSSPSCAPSTSAQAQALMLKRRRTRSPEKDINGNGPRWSVGPPSPFTFIDELGVHTHDVVQSKGKGPEREGRGMTPFAYATPHSNAPYIERDRERSGAPISVYEDESAAGDENLGGEAGDGSVTDEIDVYADQRQNFEAGMGLGTGISSEFQNYDEDEDEEDEDPNRERNFVDEGSIDLDQDRSPSLGQERQVDEEWEGVQDLDEDQNSHGIAIGDVVDEFANQEVEIFEDEYEEEDDNVSQSSSVPSEYPSTQQRMQGTKSGPVLEERLQEEGPGFRIHVDEDEDDEEDELV